MNAYKKIKKFDQLENQGDSKMKKILFGAMFWVVAMVVPLSAMAQVDIHVSIPLPPPVVFSAPPVAVVIPETYVYGFPDTREDIYFYNGWWWRSWEGRWYRSRHHDSGWVHYQHVPSFCSSIPSSWRNDYRERHWKGHPWNHQQISHDRLQNNWREWEKNKHWEKKEHWGVKRLKSKEKHRNVQSRHVQPKPYGKPIPPSHSQCRQVQTSRAMNPQTHPQRPQEFRPMGNHDRGGHERQDRR